MIMRRRNRKLDNCRGYGTFGNFMRYARFDFLKPAKESDMNFRKELTELINKHSMENDSNTPDFLLADYIEVCMDNFAETMQHNYTMKEYKKKYPDFDKALRGRRMTLKAPKENNEHNRRNR